MGTLFLRRDTALVTAIAIATTLSAFAAYQATRAGEEADEAFSHARTLQAEAARDEGRLQTLVAHDSFLLGQYCEAFIARAAVQGTLLTSAPQTTELVAASLAMESLDPLIQGDPLYSCPADDAEQEEQAEQAQKAVQEEEQEEQIGYSAQRAERRVLLDLSTDSQPAVGAAEATREAERINRQELLSMLAGVLFAATVATLIIADELGNRSARPRLIARGRVLRGRLWALGAAAVALVSGMTILLVATVDPVATAIVFGAVAAALLAEIFWTRRMRGRRTAADSQEAGTRAKWWAEIAGAVTLVIFAASAATLAAVAVSERDVRADADRQAALAQQLEHVGRQTALRDLSRLALLAVADARWTAAEHAQAVSGDGEDAAALGARWTELDRLTLQVETDLREEVQASATEHVSQDCPVITPGAALGGLDLKDISRYREWVGAYLMESEEPARACEMLAALSRTDARAWSADRSRLIVSLVVLGLCGFMFALATGRDRSPRASQTLLAVGTGGALVGIALALSTVPHMVARSDPPDRETLAAHAMAVARAESYACDPEQTVDSWHDTLDEAVRVLDRHGPVHAARAYALDCAAATYEWPAWSGDTSREVLPEIVADLRAALQAGPAGPARRADLGWYLILTGIYDDDRDALNEGLSLTDAALQEIADDERLAGSTVHTARANRALALAALGEPAAALEAYEEVSRCLAPTAGCAGGGLDDKQQRAVLRLAALSDLELLTGASRTPVDPEQVEAYRLAVMGEVAAEGTFPAVAEDAALRVWGQDMELETDAAGEAVVVWLHRRAGSDVWAVLTQPSLVTAEVGDHFGTPYSATAMLPAGEYRADVYADGRRWESEVVPREPRAGMTRLEADWVGVSLVAPEGWESQWESGTTWHVGPAEDSGVTVRRVEGVVPYVRSDEFLRGQLDLAFPEWAGREAVVEKDGWFLGGPSYRALFTSVDDENEAAAVALFPYTRGYWCGGALFVATTDQADTDVLRDMVLDRAPSSVEPLTGKVSTAGFRLTVPKDWDAATQPPGGAGPLLTARDCVGDSASVSVERTMLAGTLDEHVAGAIAGYGVSGDFPSFALVSRAAAVVDGADAAEEVVFTYVSDEWVDPVVVREIQAQHGDEVTTLRVRVYYGADPHGDVFQDLVASWRLE